MEVAVFDDGRVVTRFMFFVMTVKNYVGSMMNLHIWTGSTISLDLSNILNQSFIFPEAT